MKQREIIGKYCLKEVDLDRRVVEKVMATLEFPPDNKKYKDFLACSYKRQGFQSDDGRINYDNIKEFLSRYYSTSDLKVLDKCKSTTGGNDGDTAFKAIVCIIDSLKPLQEKHENEI